MVRLLLLRHARSAHPPGTADMDRPLCDYGRRSALAMGGWMSKHALDPALVLCSTAKRCSDTLGLILPFFRSAPKIRHLPELYLAEPPALLAAVRATSAGSPLMLVGHNPGLHEFGLAMLSRRQPPAAEEQVAAFGRKFPTAALTVIGFTPESWPSIKPATGILDEFVRPADLLATGDEE